MTAAGRPSTVRIVNIRVLRAGRIIADPGTEIWIQDGKIIDQYARFWSSADQGEYAADLVIDGGNMIAAPGYIDVQINGAFGVSFSDPDVTVADCEMVGRRLLAHGVIGFVPTLVSSAPETYARILDRLHMYEGGASRGASVLGLHLEGPFLNLLQQGAHDADLLRVPDRGLSSLYDVYGKRLDQVRLITLAPELPGAIGAVRELRAAHPEIRISIGHSNATIEECRDAITAGANFVTHMFNAMRSFHHRNPCVIGTLAPGPCRTPFYGLICDGVHTHATAVAMAYHTHPDGVVLVTDAISAAGGPASPTRLGTQNVEVGDNQVVVAGTHKLAGSILRFDEGVRRFRRYSQCTVVEALEAASLHPAQLLGLAPRKGSLDIGSDADFIIVDDNLNVLKTFVGGQPVWDRTG